MSDAFSGNLSQFKLLDILRLLHASNRTGQLELTQEDGSFAEIYFVNGQIKHAIYEEYFGEEAIYALFSWAEGTFKFRSGEVTDEETTMLTTEEIIAESVTYAADWESVRRVIPSRNTVFKLSARSSRDFSMRAEDWAVLREVDGYKSVKEIAEATQLTELQASRIMVRLYDLGLIEIGGEAEPIQQVVETVDESILSRVERELTVAIGPMAPIVMDDCVEMLGHKRSEFPKEYFPALLERLAEEIPDSDRRVRFQESMLEIMKQVL
ncbi:MAG: DUF4388 domain-containing protein [Acidobacteriota bacterium]|nr:DUF4388 domain-containing protein [Blastocatellia bacterium]MDW8412677.1 DUF4388 domain-containing protein [Acidobacteriota bacterium]